jgi:hypothetical protein
MVKMIKGLRMHKKNLTTQRLPEDIRLYPVIKIQIYMKNEIKNFMVASSVALLALSCQDKVEERYTVLEPEYMTYEDLRDAFNVKSAEDIIQPGKIYFKDDYIFVNEYMEGIHIVDNSDPSDPQVIKFLEIPGNVDLSINGNILYADSYVDLLAIDISDFENIHEVKRIVDAFPYYVPEPEEGILENVDQSRGVVTSWKEVERTVEVEPGTTYYPYYPEWDMVYSDQAGPRYNTGAIAETGFGVGGSMARFTLYDDYLYAVNQASLKLFNISTASDPVFSNDISVGWDIETLFPYNGKLFIGSQTGMYIFSLADPANPEYISSFWHASSCDPVVVDDNYAYVTLRAGNLCGEETSLLDVISISDIHNPLLIEEYPMVEPYGLGIDDSVLFVCDGSAGLKIYNANDPYAIDENMIIQYPDINAFDVIPLGDILLMIGSDGLFQYDYSDLENITQLSFIPIYN